MRKVEWARGIGFSKSIVERKENKNHYSELNNKKTKPSIMSKIYIVSRWTKKVTYN